MGAGMGGVSVDSYGRCGVPIAILGRRMGRDGGVPGTSLGGCPYRHPRGGSSGTFGTAMPSGHSWQAGRLMADGMG